MVGFLRNPLLFLSLKRIQASQLSLSVVDVHSPCITLSLVEFPHIVGPPGFCARGALPTQYVWGATRSRAYTYCVYHLHSCACCSIRLDLQDTRAKVKSLRISRWQSRALNQAGGPVPPHRLHTCEAFCIWRTLSLTSHLHSFCCLFHGEAWGALE